jgi:hypothetical protein
MTATLVISRERCRPEAYSFRSTMAHTLESLESGTPVYAGETHVADVRTVYVAEGTRQPELVAVHWLDRGEDVALPVSEIESLIDGRVVLMNSNPHTYANLVTFDASRFPTVRPLL